MAAEQRLLGRNPVEAVFRNQIQAEPIDDWDKQEGGCRIKPYPAGSKPLAIWLLDSKDTERCRRDSPYCEQ
ncbi:hypothetical protein D3C84_1226170 [compost metagenome]